MFNAFQDLIKNKDMKIIFSIIWGLGLASLFKKTCKGRDCIVYKAPPPSYIKGKSFEFDNKCYQFVPKLVKCKDKDNIST